MGLFNFQGEQMKENGIYFGKESFYQLIRDNGGVWNDSKERPIVCLIKSTENEHLYWAIPLGNLEHRNEKAKERIEFYISLPRKDIRSCYYHIGNTDVTSIFFISDAIPIIDKYIEREYLGKYTGNQYIIQNSVLLKELNRKLQRILSWEKVHPNSFRQHITDIKKQLIQELNQENEGK